MSLIGYKSQSWLQSIISILPIYNKYTAEEVVLIEISCTRRHKIGNKIIRQVNGISQYGE